MKLAIVHEWISARAGSEQVFEAIAQAFPNADLYALTREPDVVLDIGGRPVRTSWLDRRTFRDRRSLTLPVMPVVWRSFGRHDYDLVISSHHAFANSNQLARPGGHHLSYVHSPARYIWSPEIDSRGSGKLRAPVRGLLKRIDVRAAGRVQSFAANSSEVAKRVAAFWGRNAKVIPPPVRTDFYYPSEGAVEKSYVLGVGRWIPYKNLHRVIEAANVAKMPVKIAGRGPDRARLDHAASLARVPVDIIQNPSDDEVRSLYRGAACLVFPTVEDFGIVPVEAQACGVPVVAPGIGGVLDTVIDGRTGIYTRGIDAAELGRAIIASKSLYSEDCVRNAARFGLGNFQRRLLDWVGSEVQRSPVDLV